MDILYNFNIKLACYLTSSYGCIKKYKVKSSVTVLIECDKSYVSLASCNIASIYRNYNGIIDLRSFSIDESTLPATKLMIGDHSDLLSEKVKGTHTVYFSSSFS